MMHVDEEDEFGNMMPRVKNGVRSFNKPNARQANLDKLNHTLQQWQDEGLQDPNKRRFDPMSNR